MVQVVLVIVGIYLLAKGTVKISSDRELARPGSTYLGGALLAYGAGIQFIGDGLVSNLAYFVSLVAVVFFFAYRFGTKKESLVEDGNETMRNLAILLIFLAILGVAGYFYFKGLQGNV